MYENPKEQIKIFTPPITRGDCSTTEPQQLVFPSQAVLHKHNTHEQKQQLGELAFALRQGLM